MKLVSEKYTKKSLPRLSAEVASALLKAHLRTSCIKGWFLISFHDLKANIMKLLKAAILVLWYIFNVVSANNEFCNSPEVEFNGLVHPLGTIHVLRT